MTSEHWTERLSDYLEGDLSPADMSACEAHLSRCDACAADLEGIRAVVAQASLLADLPPERDLWPAIEGRLPRRDTEDADIVPITSRKRVELTVPQLVAAGIALVVLSAGSVSLLLPGAPTAAAEPTGVASASGAAAGSGGDTPSGAVGSAITPVVYAPAYDQAVTELEMAFEARRAELDPETIRVVEENLAIIDGAIAEANQALATDPSSAFLNTHLASAMRQKVDLLRRVATMQRTEI